MNNRCPRCQSVLREGTAYCEECGMKIEQHSAVPAPNQPNQPQPPYQPNQPQPQPYQPQTPGRVYYAPEPVHAQPPSAESPKSSNANTAIILLVIALIAACGVIVYLLLSRDDPKKKKDSSVLESSISTLSGTGTEQTETTVLSSTAETNLTTTLTETAAPERTTDSDRAQTSRPPEQSSEPSPPPDEINTGGYPKNSTFDRPTIDEMMWVAHIDETGVPAGAVYMDFSKACLGGWKCRFFFDESTTMLLNVIIGDGGDSIRVNLDWYLTWFNGEQPINDEDMDDGILNGYEWGAGIHADGDGTLDIDTFYRIGDYEYAIGTYTSATGMTAKVGMMRP